MPSRQTPHNQATKPIVLVLAPASAEADELLGELIGRKDLVLLRVGDVAAASRTLAEIAVALVLSCPETAVPRVTELVGEVSLLRPGTTILAVRPRQDEEPRSWRRHGVVVLRCPLLPQVLERTIDLALGLNGQAAPPAPPLKAQAQSTPSARRHS